MMIQNSYWRQQLPLSLEAVAASGTLPVFREAERMGTHYYWDGLYSNNPPIREFFSGPPQYVPDEIWIVRINPQRRPDAPQTHAEIEDRQNELMGNLSLNKELDFIFAQQHLQQLLQQQQPQAPIVRTIKMDPNTTNNLCYSSKFDRSRAFADKMRLEGREAAQAWLAKWPNVRTYPHDT
jgi:NTE family protein